MAGYKPEEMRPVRDRIYPSEIAAQRPALVTRIHCGEDFEDRQSAIDNSIRGDQGTLNEEGRREITEDASERFNRALRHGHGDRP